MAKLTVFTPEQKAIADKVNRVFCLNVMLVFLCNMSILSYLPLVTMDLGIDDKVTGTLLMIQPFTCICSVPLIRWLVVKLGVENIILGSGIIFSVTAIIIGIVCETESATTFLAVVFPCSFLNGFGQACNMVGEQTLLLNYSQKEDREKTLGMFRGAIGIAGAFAPYVGAAMYAWHEERTVFCLNGSLAMAVLPLVYWYISKARDAFKNAESNAQRFEAETEDTERLLNEQSP